MGKKKKLADTNQQQTRGGCTVDGRRRWLRAGPKMATDQWDDGEHGTVLPVVVKFSFSQAWRLLRKDTKSFASLQLFQRVATSCARKSFSSVSPPKKNLSTFDFECQHFSCEIPRHFLAIPEMSFFSHCHTFHSGHVATHSAVNRFPTFQPRNSRPVSNREIKDEPGPATRGGKKRWRSLFIDLFSCRFVFHSLKLDAWSLLGWSFSPLLRRAKMELEGGKLS